MVRVVQMLVAVEEEVVVVEVEELLLVEGEEGELGEVVPQHSYLLHWLFFPFLVSCCWETLSW